MKRNFLLIWLLLALALSAFAQTPIRKPTSASGGGSGVTDGDKGDLTISGTGATYTVDANAITFAKMVQISSGGLLGRATAGTGNIEALTAAQARTLLGLGVADSVVFGTISASKDWGSVSAANIVAKFASYGDANRLVFLRGNGTAASPTQLLADEVIFNIQARGVDNAGAESAASRASLNAIAAENFTNSAQGVKWLFTVTPTGSTSAIQAMQLNANGSMRLPQLAGGGSRILNVDNNGDIGAQSSAVTPRTYSGAYSIFPKNSNGDSSGAYTANTVYFYKASEPDAITINRIGTYVFTGSAGATLDIGFYSSDCATKLISTGATDVTSSSTSLAVTVTGTTISGGVCVMWTTSSATPTYQQLTWAANAWRFANSNGATPILGTCSNTASGGALPASCGTLTSSNTLAPIAVRAWVN